MKSRFIIICLFLLLLTVTAVSAQDNITDESTCDAYNSSNIDKLSQDSQEDVLQDDPLNVHLTTDNYTKGEDIKVVYRITSDKALVTIDGVQKSVEYVDEDDEEDTVLFVSTEGLDLGDHVLNVKFINKNGQIYVNKTFQINIGYIITHVPENIYIGEFNEMYVNFASDVEGSLKITIDENVFYESEARNIYEDLSDLLSFGSHNITFNYFNGNYPDYSRTFKVNASYRFSLRNETTRYSDDRNLYFFWGPSNLDMNKLAAEIDGVVYNVSNDGDDFFSIDITELSIAEHKLSIVYAGDDKVPPLSANATITVIPYFSTSGFLIVDEGHDVYFRISKDANSNLEIYVDGQSYKSEPFVNGEASIFLKIPKLGEHNVTYRITGDCAFEYNDTITVYLNIESPNIIYPGENNNYVLKLPDAQGNVVANFEGIIVTAPFVNGVATIPIPKTLKVGWYTVNFTYEDMSNPFNESDLFSIDPKFEVTKTVIDGVGEVSISLPYSDNVGKLIVKIDDGEKEYVLSKTLVDGKASISLAGLASGTYDVLPIYFDGIEKFMFGSYPVTVKNSKLTASDLKMYYSSGSSFKVKVTGYNGKVVKNGKVKFYINGKYVKTVKTNNKGFAYLKISNAPGKYNITAKYIGLEITKNLTVKHVLTLKTVKVKRSAKKLVLKVTLKKGKTAIKYKKVTFKFNGKTYTAKTNKKGVAKVTIKKLALKKLKVGKKVTYQAKYLKDTVKKVAIVKK